MASKVYFIPTQDDDSVATVSRKLKTLIAGSGVTDFINRGDFVGLKIHFGEDGNKGHIRHEWAEEAAKCALEKTKNLFLTDTNVLYKESSRANAVDHLKLADRHGFTFKDIKVPVIIADGLHGRSYAEVPVGGKHFSSVKLGSEIVNADGLLVLSHLTGHILTGLAAALKNLGMGCASRRGKYEQHCGVVPEVKTSFCVACGMCVKNCPAGCIAIKSKKAAIDAKRCIGCGECVVVCRTKAIETKWSEKIEILQQKMVEYAKGVIGSLNGKLGYITFLINITSECDCLAKDDPKIARDIGILASHDPVSIDKAAADIVNRAEGRDVLREAHGQIDWSVQLEYASRMGLGNLEYELVEI